ncbi:nitrate- and nitrite sensing domain-containing protein [Actinoplanes sp. NPDC051343]|uniref:sensor histidine kinase n=1 Tax=Actinoplanes sp. NPDC051343 TaxID=3363906 RepID=UPI0037BB7E06
MRTRNWSIRSKIIALITVPLVAFLALWIFATTLTAGPAFNLLHARTLVDEVGTPGIELVGQLQRERLFSVEYLSGSGAVPKALTDQRAATDRVAAQFRRTAGSDAVQNAANDALHNRIAGIITELDSLTGNRSHIDRREIDAIGAQNFYNKVIDGAFKMFAACATFNDQSIDRELKALTTVGNGEEYLGRVDSLVAGATAAGSLNADMRDELLQDVGTARYLLDQGIDDMTASERAEWVELSAGDGYIRLDKMLDQLVQDSKVDAPPPVASSVYRPTYVAVGQQVREFEDRATDSLAKRATPLAVSVLVRLALAAVLGLLALVISLIVSVKIGRSIVGRLGRLRAEAQEMADERLPSVVRRLQRGEAVDVAVEAPPLAYGLDEIGQLGNAFNDVQRTAVQSAVDESTVRRGVNEVFLNIARRSQTLLHRQLALLDKMERRENEPQELEDLYRVDHLATRMRRHAEDLVILAGAAPGRGWRNPVPVIDVVRGAISEVEDYKRVDIRTIEQSAVLGRAVGDVIHLLAELLENAASFSPPHTRVQVGGQVLPNGYAIEIEDRGLGMSPEAIEEANRRLLEPPDFDPSDSARLGLFVVAQLAGRHGIRVSLRPSAYAGVTAIVLIPADLIVVGPGPIAKPLERPLVGSGTEDRPSLAALQGPGQVSVAGRPVTINGTAARQLAETGWEPRPAAPSLTGPAPATPAPTTPPGELNADGLVQRRRNRRPTTPKPASTPPTTRDRSGPTSFAPDGLAGADSPGRDSLAGLAGTESTGLARPAGFAGTDPTGPGGTDREGPSGLAGLTGGDFTNLAGPRIPAPRSPESPVTPTSSSPLFPQAGQPGPVASGPPAPTSAAPMFAAPTSGPPSPVANRPGTDLPDTDRLGTDLPGTDQPGTDRPGTDRPGIHRPTGTGTPADDSATGSAEPGDRKPGEGSASASGLPSGLGWPGGFGSPAGLDLPGLDAPTISLPAVGRPPSEPTGSPTSPPDRNGSSSDTPDTSTPSAENSSGSGLIGRGAGRGNGTGNGSGNGNGGGIAAGEPGPSTEDGLPRRVRQANLAPQLRHRPPTPLPDEETVPLRPPEQIRAIMSALQQGTQRGRRDAARIEPSPADPTSREADSTPESSDLEKTGNGALSGGASFADAATVSFPAIVNLAAAAGEAKDETGGDGAVGDRATGTEQTDVTRPEKDA